jgi:iron complex outermembrane receptor protein
VVVALAFATASATEGEEIVVVGAAPSPETTPSQVTVVAVDDTFPLTADVATAVDRAPGTVVRRLGGFGDLAEVGLRGSSARHTTVLIDGFPLNPEGGSAVDLSGLPLTGFERVEVYRGTSPLLLGATSLGGAIHLVTGRGDAASGAIGAGSFGTATGSVLLAGDVGDDAHLWASADGLASAGDFPWYDTNGTPHTQEDDATRVRANNDVVRLATVTRAEVGPFAALHVGTWSDGGVPGFAFAPADAVRYAVDRNLVGLSATHARGSTLGAVRVHGLTRNDRLDDPEDEVGVGAGSRIDRTRTAGVNASLRGAIRPRMLLEGTADLRDDHFRTDDPSSGATGPPSGRTVIRGGVGMQAVLGPVLVVPAVAAIGLRARGTGAGTGTGTQIWEGAVLPRVGAVGDAGSIVLKGNVGTFFRPPDPLELFGDRGVLVGNAELRSERGVQVDLGARWAPSGAWAEAVLFGAWSEDLVAWVQNAQGVARPENLGDTRSLGVEAAGGYVADLVEVSGNVTAVHARDTEAETFVPRVPAFELFALGAITPDPVRLAADLSLTAGTFSDRANQMLQPPRILVGATATVRRGPVALELDVRNLFDVRTANVPRDPLVDDGVRVPATLVDFTGYPLPGRSFLLSVRWRT